MLTDIFAYRYQGRTLFSEFREADRRLLMQAFQIVDKDLMPYFGRDGQERPGAKAQWQSVHDRMCRELGVKELSPKAYSYPASGREPPPLKWSDSKYGFSS